MSFDAERHFSFSFSKIRALSSGPDGTRRRHTAICRGLGQEFCTQRSSSILIIDRRGSASTHRHIVGTYTYQHTTVTTRVRATLTHVPFTRGRVRQSQLPFFARREPRLRHLAVRRGRRARSRRWGRTLCCASASLCEARSAENAPRPARAPPQVAGVKVVAAAPRKQRSSTRRGSSLRSCARLRSARSSATLTCFFSPRDAHTRLACKRRAGDARVSGECVADVASRTSPQAFAPLAVGGGRQDDSPVCRSVRSSLSRSGSQSISSEESEQ